MDKLQNNYLDGDIKTFIFGLVLVVIVISSLVISGVLPTNKAQAAGSADIGRIAQPGCLGAVRIFHDAEVTTGEKLISLPDNCQFGAVFLTAESIHDGPVIANYALNHGYLTINTTLLSPLPYPVQPKISYAVIPIP